MSNSTAQQRAPKRAYKLGKRAQQQSETRQRIVEAAIELHSSVGPARTTVAQIAERAGVQRHTYYAHFPEEWDLLLACSRLALERDPLPNPGELLRIPAGRKRVQHGLQLFYAWFARNEQQAACVLRDSEQHEPTRRIVDLRMSPTFSAAAQIMGEGLNERSRSLLGVGLDFNCWRRLNSTHSAQAAADLIADAIDGLAG